MLTEHASKGWIPLSVSINFVSPTPVVRRPRHYVESHIKKSRRLRLQKSVVHLSDDKLYKKL